MKTARLGAHEQVQLLIVFESFSHLRDHPGPEPVGTRWVLRILRQEIDRHAHPDLPASFHKHQMRLLSHRTRALSGCHHFRRYLMRSRPLSFATDGWTGPKRA